MTPHPMRVERETPFRRRRFVASHRRRSLAAQLWRPFLGALTTVGVPLAVALWVMRSPDFRLTQVVVAGTHRVETQWVAGALEPLRGRQILWLSLDEVERRLEDHPWIAGAEIHKELPNRLVVDVVERRPAALLRRADELLFVDRAGEVIAPFDPALGVADLVLLSAADAPARELAGALGMVETIGQVEPRLAAELSEVELLGQGDYRLLIASLPYPILVNGERLRPGLARLRRYATDISSRYGTVGAVDLRFSRQIVIQPAASPRI